MFLSIILQLESAAVSHQILLNPPPASEKHITVNSTAKTKKSATNKKKKKKVVSKKQAPVKSEPSKHYRLNLADIPFVAGKVRIRIWIRSTLLSPKRYYTVVLKITAQK